MVMEESREETVLAEVPAAQPEESPVQIIEVLSEPVREEATSPAASDPDSPKGITDEELQSAWLEAQPAKVSRFKTAPWYKSDYLERPITVGGAGGIGSWLCFYLARIGLTPTVWDFDIIEEHNLGGQLYSSAHIGVPKVVGLNLILEQLCGEDSIDYCAERLDETSHTWPICLSAFDNMSARKVMFTRWVDLHGKDNDAIFIDGRMLAEGGQVFVVHGNNEFQISEYKKTLFEDSEVADQPCTMKATSHCGSFVAILITSLLTNWATNKEAGRKEQTPVRNIPFATRFELPLLMIETYEDSKSFV